MDYTRPPESLRPDRPELMNQVGGGKKVTIAEQVEFECLVGSHNQAPQLTTGLGSRFSRARACRITRTHSPNRSRS